MYSLQTRKFIVSRDVQFSEDIFPFQSSNPTQFPNYNDLFTDMVLPNHVRDISQVVPPEMHVPPVENDKPGVVNNDPGPVSSVPPLVPLRRSTRVTRPHQNLNQYALSVTYPIQKYLAYDKISPSFKDFIHQAVKYPHWRRQCKRR